MIIADDKADNKVVRSEDERREAYKKKILDGTFMTMSIVKPMERHADKKKRYNLHLMSVSEDKDNKSLADDFKNKKEDTLPILVKRGNQIWIYGKKEDGTWDFTRLKNLEGSGFLSKFPEVNALEVLFKSSEVPKRILKEIALRKGHTQGKAPDAKIVLSKEERDAQYGRVIDELKVALKDFKEGVHFASTNTGLGALKRLFFEEILEFSKEYQKKMESSDLQREFARLIRSSGSAAELAVMDKMTELEDKQAEFALKTIYDAESVVERSQIFAKQVQQKRPMFPVGVALSSPDGTVQKMDNKPHKLGNDAGITVEIIETASDVKPAEETHQAPEKQVQQPVPAVPPVRVALKTIYIYDEKFTNDIYPTPENQRQQPVSPVGVALSSPKATGQKSDSESPKPIKEVPLSPPPAPPTVARPQLKLANAIEESPRHVNTHKYEHVVRQVNKFQTKLDKYAHKVVVIINKDLASKQESKKLIKLLDKVSKIYVQLDVLKQSQYPKLTQDRVILVQSLIRVSQKKVVEIVENIIGKRGLNISGKDAKKILDLATKGQQKHNKHRRSAVSDFVFAAASIAVMAAALNVALPVVALVASVAGIGYGSLNKLLKPVARKEGKEGNLKDVKQDASAAPIDGKQDVSTPDAGRKLGRVGVFGENGTKKEVAKEVAPEQQKEAQNQEMPSLMQT